MRSGGGGLRFDAFWPSPCPSSPWQVEQYAAKNPQVLFVDVNPALFDAAGTSRTDLFMNDQLHLRPPAYEAFAGILKPVLTKALQ